MSLRKRLAALTRDEREAVAILARTVDGLVVWSSNRSGNHELYLLDLRGQTIRQLTHNPHVDFFSRFSPDGRRVLFLRSQREWVSFREEGAWDVMLVNVDGTGEQLLGAGWVPPDLGGRGDRRPVRAGLSSCGDSIWRPVPSSSSWTARATSPG